VDVKGLAMFLCLLVAVASLCHAQVPQAQVVMSADCYSPSTSSSARTDFEAAYSPSTSCSVGSTFVLNQSIEKPFTVYAVVFMPNGSMLNALTLTPKVKPVASNVSHLDAPFSYELWCRDDIPGGAPLGLYEVVVAFFDPWKPITGRQDAFLDVSAKFKIGWCG